MHSVYFPTSELNPFNLDVRADYLAWRAHKLAAYPMAHSVIEIHNPYQLTASERIQLMSQCQKFNFALYQIAADKPIEKAALQALAAQLGLTRLDHNLCADDEGIAALQVVAHGRAQEYIPYTNRPINWHTDGYYNPFAQQVHAILMHCVRPALTGGENQLLDHEIAYIQLRDHNPEYITALMAPKVMTIPANFEQGVEIRPTQTGPVFSVNPHTGKLHMRYTARTRSIIWQQEAKAALTALTQLLNNDSPYITRHRLTANQGIICNNVLHNRAGFTDGTEAEQKRYNNRFCSASV
ncbi:MAG: TauD/TfdA family dioxygenase, partial [Pseudomonadota bacterium]|nr:TauD/TfdA family dioxygenase [Pseudomonadota bacterium]